MDTSHWPQEMLVKPIEEIISNVYKKPQNNQQNQRTAAADSEQMKPTRAIAASAKQPQQIVNCPRCNSTNTKFCYYNNYSLTQPRYFCKTCRRYWTEGGSLRNIPVGGATRKNNNNHKRPNSSNSSSPTSKKLHISSLSLDQQPNPNDPHHAKLVQNQNHGQDLKLTFPSSQHFRSIGEFSHLPGMDQNTGKGDSTASTNSSVSAMEHLNGLQDSRGFSTFMPMPNLDTFNTIYSSGYHQNLSNLSNMPEFKPILSFSLDHHHDHNGYNENFQDQEPGNCGGSGDVGRDLFPFEDLKQVSHSSTTTGIISDSAQQQINTNRNNGGGNDVDSSGGYWSGMLGGGSW